MRKILYILIAPKGSEKTYIGSKVKKDTDIKFLRVEPILLKLAPGENGWETVEKEIDKEFQQHSKVMIESLGAGDGFNRMHSSLRNKAVKASAAARINQLQATLSQMEATLGAIASG